MLHLRHTGIRPMCSAVVLQWYSPTPIIPRANPPLSSSLYHSTSSLLPCSRSHYLPLISLLWRGPADHAESASASVIVCAGGRGGWISRFHAVNYVRMCVVSVANVPLPVQPMACLVEQQEGFLHWRIYTVREGVVSMGGDGMSGGLSWVAVTAGEDKTPTMSLYQNPPHPLVFL